MVQVTIEKVLEERDADAGLLLLQRMLNLDEGVLGARRTQLLAMQKRLEKTRKLDSDDRKKVVSTYREVIG